MSNKIARVAIMITLITLLSKLAGFIRDVIMATTYGTTIDADAFIMAQSITGVITGLALGALAITFIPIMSDYLLHKTKAETNKFLNVVYTVTIGLTLLISIVGMIFSEELVSLFAPNFSEEAHKLTVQLTRIMMPIIVLTGVVNLNNAKLQNHGSHLVSAFIGFPMNFMMIMAMLFLTDSIGIHGLSIALVVGVLLQIVLQTPFTLKLGYRYKIDFDLKEEGMRRIGVLIVPILIGTGIQQINTMIDRILASGLAEGSIAALNYSNRLSLFVISLFSAAIGSIFYTSMSSYSSAGKSELFKKLLRNTINISMILILPASVGLIALRIPIIQLIFQRGLFDSSASMMTANALLFYTIGLIGFLLRDIVSRAFYALKDTKTAMINGSIAVGINIVLSIILVRSMGLGGLALGTSISGIVGTILLIYSLHKKMGDFGLRNIMLTFFKLLGSCMIMGIYVFYCYEFLHATFHSNLLSVVISILTGILLYGGLIWSLKIDEIHLMKSMLISMRDKYTRK